MRPLIITQPLLSPLAAEGGGGKTVTSEDGVLVNSDGSDNSPDALEVTEDTPSNNTIDFDLFTGESDEPANRTTAKKMPQRKAAPEVAPVEDKIEGENENIEGQEEDNTEVEGEEDETPAQPTATTSQQPTVKRDYTKFQPDEVKLLKSLPNKSYAEVSKILLQRKEIEKSLTEAKAEIENLKSANPRLRIPDSWTDHEEAFTLTPQYKDITALYGKVSYEASYWEQQLIRIEKGLPCRDLVYDKETGQFKEGEEYDPSPENKYAIKKAYDSALKTQSQLEGQAAAMAKEFKAVAQQNSAYYERPEVNKRFDQLLPELKPKDEHIKIFSEGVLLPHHQNSGLGKLAAKMFSVILNQGQMINKLRGKTSAAARNANDVIAAGAKSKPKPAAGVKKLLAGKGEVIDLDEFDTEMKGEGLEQ